MHENMIRSARRRVWLAAAGGLLVLTGTVTTIVFPVAWGIGALSNALGSGLGLGWDLILWAAWVSAVLGAIVATATFGWSLLHAEARVLEFVRAWPGPRAAPNPPPLLPEGALEQAEKLLIGLGLAAGIHAPRVAVVIDDAPNCLTVGRTPATAWIVVTTGLLETLPKRELEAVLAYEMGRVVELEVSLDTVVYALTSRTFELLAAAFADLHHVTLLLAPLAFVSLPFLILCGLLRASVLRSRGRLADGLAVRYCRNPVALAQALRMIFEDKHEVRRGDPANAHLWLEYPHTRASRWLMRTHRMLPKRVRKLERAIGLRQVAPVSVLGSQRGHDVLEERVIGAVLVDVLVQQSVTGTYDEGRAELGDATAGLVDAMSSSTGPGCSWPAPPVEHELDEVRRRQLRHASGARVVVDEHGERHVLFFDECGGIAHTPGADRDDLGTEAPDLVIALAQLRSVLSAEQSAEMTQEHDDDRPLGPEVAEATRHARCILQLERTKCRHLHTTTVLPRRAIRARSCETRSMATTFTRMDKSTAEQWSAIGKETMGHQERVAESILSMLRSLATITDGFAVDQLTHSLQTATLAERSGADDEIVIASLCHDIGKAVSVPNHPRIAGEILKSYVRDEVYQMILAHQDFQGRHYYAHFGGDPDAREQYRGQPWFELAERFADEWDQIAFDPDYDTLPLEHFEPRVRALFGTPRSF